MDLWVFISRRAIPWLATMCKSAAPAAARPLDGGGFMGVDDKSELFAGGSSFRLVRIQQGRCEVQGPRGLLFPLSVG